jgi:hypothetical protein
MPDLGAPEAGLRRERRPWPARGEVDGLALAPSAPTLRGGRSCSDGGRGCLLSRARGGGCLHTAGTAATASTHVTRRSAPGHASPDRAARRVDKYGVPAANPSCPTDIRFYTTGCNESILHTAQNIFCRMDTKADCHGMNDTNRR